jgi:hypothetical protein
MSKYRNNLPQLKEEKLFLVDGGLETFLYFNKGNYFIMKLNNSNF